LLGTWKNINEMCTYCIGGEILLKNKEFEMKEKEISEYLKELLIQKC